MMMKDDESAERGHVSKDNDQKLIITVEDQVQVLQEDKEIVRTGADQIHPIQNATSNSSHSQTGGPCPRPFVNRPADRLVQAARGRLKTSKLKAG